MAKSKSDISLNDLKAMLPQEGEPAELEATLRALSSLSPEDRDLLATVQELSLIHIYMEQEKLYVIEEKTYEAHIDERCV